MAGASIAGGIDFWEPAIQSYKLNFPGAETWRGRIEGITAKSVAEKIGHIDLLLASPECTNHTFAKGNRRVGEEQERSRRTAFEVIRFAKSLAPRWIVVENVVSMRRWDHYEAWKGKLRALDYQIREVVLDSQEFGVPQTRRRLFVLCDLEREPKAPQALNVSPATVTEILHSADSNGQYNGFSYDMSKLFGRRPGRAKDTLTRARRAIAALGKKKPFLIVYYGTDAAGGWQSLDRPLRTITTLDRFALVTPTSDGHVMRMLQPPELAKAMGFPDDYRWPDVTRRERIKLVGNAVAPPVMKAVVKALTARP
jgi:DNA (cytosine-5)-methyltransferase 1